MTSGSQQLVRGATINKMDRFRRTLGTLIKRCTAIEQLALFKNRFYGDAVFNAAILHTLHRPESCDNEYLEGKELACHQCRSERYKLFLVLGSIGSFSYIKGHE